MADANYRIRQIDLLVRTTPPDRAAFAIAGSSQGKPQKRRPRGILLARMLLEDRSGKRSWGVSGDRPSFGWLDKRKEFSADEKLQRLFDLVRQARDVYGSEPFDTPHAHWRRCLAEVMRIGKQSRHESLTCSYASALIERAMIDAVCRLHDSSFFDAVRQGLLGVPPLEGKPLKRLLPPRPRTSFHVRHTVGLSDPLRDSDIPPADRIDDGEPESLEAYARRDGLRYFKVKISGDPRRDLRRLERIWSVVGRLNMPVVTLDGNESYDDIGAFAKFVDAFEERLLGLFQHTAFIEQPLTRALTMDPATAAVVSRIGRKKPLVIDEADGELDSFSRAYAIGYRGCSHKNCKGVLKSLLNWRRCRQQLPAAFQTAEDLSVMPLAPLQQDFAALGVLGIAHCERNGHHYARGLSHLTEREKQLALRHHGDLYERRGDEVFLRIRDGQVRCPSLQCPGFGVRFQPDWDALTPLGEWDVVW